MKKTLTKIAIIAGIATFGIFAGSFMVSAQQPMGFGDAAGGINVVGDTNTMQGAGLIGIIKNFINWVLGMLSLIALVIALYGGFKMVTAAGDDGKYKEGFKVLKQAAVGLIVVGLSWFFVSAIFWILGAGGSSAGITDSPTK